MIGLKIDQAKGMFFDAPKVMRSVDAATRRVLSKFGAYVRTAAQSSMLGHVTRKGFGAKSKVTNRKGTSKPGQPPTPHTGDLVKFIFFGYDAMRQSVVVGPTRLNKVSFSEDMMPTRGTVPENLEYGGTAYVLEEWTGNHWRRRDLRRRGSVSDVGAIRESGKSNVFNRRPIRKRRVTVAARPYMHPALKQELPTLPAMWANSVKP